MEKHSTNSSEQFKKMERDALKVFISGSGLVFGAAMYYAYTTGNMLCFEILIGVVVFLAIFLAMIFRSKKPTVKQPASKSSALLNDAST